MPVAAEAGASGTQTASRQQLLWAVGKGSIWHTWVNVMWGE